MFTDNRIIEEADEPACELPTHPAESALSLEQRLRQEGWQVDCKKGPIGTREYVLRFDTHPA